MRFVYSVFVEKCVCAVAWHFNTPHTHTVTLSQAHTYARLFIQYLLVVVLICCLLLLPILLLTATTPTMMDGCTKSCSNTLLLPQMLFVDLIYLRTYVRICFSAVVVVCC